jgi:hypothetical protein
MRFQPRLPTFALVGLLGAPLASACVTPRELWAQGGHGYKPGIERAAFELDCPQDQLATTELGHLEFGVKGCGKAATYHFNTNLGGWYRVERLDSPDRR